MQVYIFGIGKRLLSVAKKLAYVNTLCYIKASFSKKNMLLPLTKVPTPTLHDPSKALSKEDLATDDMKQLIANMIPTMYHEHGIGLAAPQVA